MVTVRFSDVIWSKIGLSLPTGECHQLRNLTVEKAETQSTALENHYVVRHALSKNVICTLIVDDEETGLFRELLSAIIRTKLDLVTMGS